MKIYDVSMSIHPDMPVYKNRAENRPVIGKIRDVDSDGVNESVITMNLHTGTHVDAPRHLSNPGEGIDKLSLDLLFGPCRVLDLTAVASRITNQDLLPSNITPGEAIFLKTANSLSDFIPTEFVYLAESGAIHLAEHKVRLVGIDSLGIERDQPGHPTHRHLMAAGTIIVEGLRLSDIEAGTYRMFCLPLKIKGGDGAPARVILLDDYRVNPLL
jgi:arylformamidase